MEHEFIAHHIEDDDSGLKHLIDSKQLKKVLGRPLDVLDGRCRGPQLGAP